MAAATERTDGQRTAKELTNGQTTERKMTKRFSVNRIMGAVALRVDGMENVKRET